MLQWVQVILGEIIMSDENEKTATTLSENAKKYKTLGRALLANDVSACREILDIYRSTGKELTPEEVFRLGMSWLASKERKSEVAEFLNELNFDFQQLTVMGEEQSGQRLPFRLLSTEKDQELLLSLIDKKWVEIDIMDGVGDSLLVNALQLGQFDFAETLLNKGCDINASNIGGATALHIFANRLNFQAVEWLGRHGADPTIEDIADNIPAQMVPEHMDGGWNTDCMFEVLSDYADKWPSKKSSGFELNVDFSEMLERERKNDDAEDNQTYGDQANTAKSILGGLGL